MSNDRKRCTCFCLLLKLLQVFISFVLWLIPKKKDGKIANRYPCPHALPSTICAQCKMGVPLLQLSEQYVLMHGAPFREADHPNPLAFVTPSKLREPALESRQISFACNQCATTLTSSRGLAAHMRVHDGPYMCSCQTLFLTLGQLRRHKTRHTNKNICKNCGLSLG